MPAALFGITNDALNLVVNLLILFLVVLWIALIAWTFFDARRRISDPILVASATAASLFPFLGTIVYSILRPPEFLADKRERELEIRASELRVRQLEEASCPNCEHPVERTFLRCPNCRARIKDPCESCGKPIDPRWTICPYCETPQRRAAVRGAPAVDQRQAALEVGSAGQRRAVDASRALERDQDQVPEPAHERSHQQPVELVRVQQPGRAAARGRADPGVEPAGVELAFVAQRQPQRLLQPLGLAELVQARRVASARPSCRLPRRWPRTPAP